MDATLDEAAVNAGNLYCNTSALLRQLQSDLLDSNLLAQLVADKQCSRFTEIAEWYKVYCETLSRFAWQFGSMRLSAQNTDDFFTAQDIILKALRTVQPPEKVSLAADAMEALRQLEPDSKPQLIFRQFDHLSTKRSSVVNLQISVLSPPTDICVIALFFQTRQAVGSALDTKFEASKLQDKVQTGILLATLNEEVYSTIRQKIIDKLGAKPDELIARFPVQPSAE